MRRRLLERPTRLRWESSLSALGMVITRGLRYRLLKRKRSYGTQNRK